MAAIRNVTNLRGGYELRKNYSLDNGSHSHEHHVQPYRFQKTSFSMSFNELQMLHHNIFCQLKQANILKKK